MIIKELITKENMHLEDAYKRLSEIKQLEVYSVDTLTTMEYIEDEIRCLEYLIAHLRSFALKMRSTS